MLSQIELIRQVLPSTIRRGRGTITTTGSLSTEVSMIHLGAYVPSKAGLTKYAVDLQSELRDSGIRVFTFVLGSVKGTGGQGGRRRSVVEFIERRTGDIGVLTPARIAKQIVEVLASERKSAVITIPKAAASTHPVPAPHRQNGRSSHGTPCETFQALDEEMIVPLDGTRPASANEDFTGENGPADEVVARHDD